MKTDLERTGEAAVAGAAPCYALRDTRIEMAGVLRCCLATVAEEYEGGDKGQDKPVSIGMKSQCRHCKQAFTLTEAKPHPKWKPDWQLNGHNSALSQGGPATHNTKQEPEPPLAPANG